VLSVWALSALYPGGAGPEKTEKGARCVPPGEQVKFLDALRNRGSHDVPDVGEPPADEADAPMPGYDKLDDRQIAARLDGLSQVELAAVEAYERSHLDRTQVLDKLRYMRTDEPLPGYDGLNPEQIAEALAGADAETVKAVRDYERKFAHRPRVMDEAARVLPTAQPSAGEARAREAQEARVREGFSKREKTTRDLPGGGAR